jgi:hypothetical protein
MFAAGTPRERERGRVLSPRAPASLCDDAAKKKRGHTSCRRQDQCCIKAKPIRTLVFCVSGRVLEDAFFWWDGRERKRGRAPAAATRRPARARSSIGSRFGKRIRKLRCVSLLAAPEGRSGSLERCDRHCHRSRARARAERGGERRTLVVDGRRNRVRRSRSQVVRGRPEGSRYCNYSVDVSRLLRRKSGCEEGGGGGRDGSKRDGRRRERRRSTAAARGARQTIRTTAAVRSLKPQ